MKKINKILKLITTNKKIIIPVFLGIIFVIFSVVVISSFGKNGNNKIVFGQNINFNELGFSMEFDSGQAQQFQKIGTDTYSFRARMTPGDSWNSAWINFMMKDVKDRDITFNLLGVGGVGDFYSNKNPAGKQMVYTCDGKDWKYISPGVFNSATGTYTFKHKFECNVAQIATYFPYPYEDIQNFKQSLKKLPVAKVTTLGKSEQGRDIDMLELTNFNIPASQKKHVIMITRQHPSEPYGTFMTHGMIDEILSDKKYTDKFHFYIVLAANPDSIVNGHSRRNANNIDTNRDWSGTPQTAEVKAMKPKFIQIADTVGVNVFIDHHGYAGGEIRSQMLSARGNLMNQYYMNVISRTNFAHQHNLFSIDSNTAACSRSSTSGQTAASFGCSLGANIAFTMEAGQSSPLWTIDRLKDDGAQMTKAMFAVFYPGG